METLRTDEPFHAVAEIQDETIRGNEEECGQCDNRFRCWTNRGLVVTINNFTATRNIAGALDLFRLTTNKLPECFRCGNLINKEILIKTSHGSILHGYITKMTVTATKFGMTAEIEGINVGDRR